MGERNIILESADKGAVSVGDIIGTVLVLPFLGLLLTHTAMLNKRDSDKTAALAGDEGGGGHGH